MQTQTNKEYNTNKNGTRGIRDNTFYTTLTGVEILITHSTTKKQWVNCGGLTQKICAKKLCQ